MTNDISIIAEKLFIRSSDGKNRGKIVSTLNCYDLKEHFNELGIEYLEQTPENYKLITINENDFNLLKLTTDIEFLKYPSTTCCFYYATYYREQ